MSLQHRPELLVSLGRVGTAKKNVDAAVLRFVDLLGEDIGDTVQDLEEQIAGIPPPLLPTPRTLNEVITAGTTLGFWTTLDAPATFNEAVQRMFAPATLNQLIKAGTGFKLWQ